MKRIGLSEDHSKSYTTLYIPPRLYYTENTEDKKYEEKFEQLYSPLYIPLYIPLRL